VRKRLSKVQVAKLIQSHFSVPHRQVRIRRLTPAKWDVYFEVGTSAGKIGISLKGRTLLKCALRNRFLRERLEAEAATHEEARKRHEERFLPPERRTA
jgi:hypothetical protein